MGFRMQSVFSSNVKSVGYDDETSTLYVEWTNTKTGKASAYVGVPLDVFEQLLKAPSIGGMMHNDIKPNYNHKYVDLPS